MAKSDEIAYLDALGPEGARHALDKPFADEFCSRQLMDLGQIFGLLPEPPARVLDLGVGSGWTSVFYARRGFRVVGQDIAPSMIELAERNRARYGVEDAVDFVVEDYEAMAYDAEFDAAVFYDSLHHAEDERLVLERVFRALRPGGRCITVEPGEGHSTSERSLAAVERWGVTEKDMPPAHIVALGREIGFRRYELHERVGSRRLHTADSMNLPAFGVGRLYLALRFAKCAVRALARGAYAADLPFFDLPAERDFRADHVVVMIK